VLNKFIHQTKKPRNQTKATTKNEKGEQSSKFEVKQSKQSNNKTNKTKQNNKIDRTILSVSASRCASASASSSYYHNSAKRVT
jgi:hypothetical protein